MAKLLKALAALSTVGVIGTAHAGAITVQFSGSILSYRDFPQYSTTYPERVGTAISGYLIYNVDNAESARVETLPNGTQNNFVTSDQGCSNVYLGGCQTDLGAGRAVLTEYRVFTSWGTISNLAADQGTTSSFGFTRSGVTADSRDLYERVDANRSDELHQEFSDGSTSYIQRQLGLSVFNYLSHGVLFDDISDLDQLPSADPAPGLGQVQSYLQLQNFAQDCPDNFGIGQCSDSADSLFMVAGLDTVTFRRGVHGVPEPASLALVGAALLGVLTVRRRQTPTLSAERALRSGRR